MHVSSAIHQLSTSNESDLVELVGSLLAGKFHDLSEADFTDSSRPGKCVWRTYSSLSAQIVCQKLRREGTTSNYKSGATAFMMVSDVT